MLHDQIDAGHEMALHEYRVGHVTDIVTKTPERSEKNSDSQEKSGNVRMRHQTRRLLWWLLPLADPSLARR
ncbi:hypothetical protein PZN02_001586 [Sinorhizobium garamanticum]|uniref:Uncharacterized protein n=1 Tax=Sinorhizobium garamanticum TaxID=680247 RepID=A0ABY8DDT6_9HYPH|nr:hypothetical protein [Sinorhizobium garamanticum]WEX89045.1 hypothetical protein PZN02_001586 [Sinorhizobium garamanticum]